MAVTNVWTRGALLLLLLASDASSSSSSAVAYNLVPRSTAAVLPAARHALERAMVGGNFSDLLSFDGDVEALKALALEKAASQEDGEPAPPSSFSCDDAEAVLHLEIIQWKYSIETVPTAVVQTVYGEVQEITLEHVAPRSLSCLNETAAFAHIVALDTSIPGHQESAETCVPDLDPSYTCTNVIGRMRVFLSSKDSAQLASALIVDNIKTAFLDPTFVSSVGSGLMRIAFIDTNSDISDNPLEDETENDGNNGGDNDEVSVLGLSLGNIVFISMGSISLFVLVSSFYVWRRRRSDDQDGAATRLANASSYNSTTFDNSSRRPTSPYSEMVSGSYRLDRLGEMSIMSNSNMSPVYEQDQEDTDTAAGSIIVSEGGYTTDAGCTEGGDSTCNESESKVSSSQSEPRFLGARPFPGAVNMDMEEISDSDLDTSGEMSPVKMYIGSSKQQLLLLPSGSDPDEEDSQADESLLFSPQQKPADMGSTITSDMQSMSPEFVPISLSESLSPCSP